MEEIKDPTENLIDNNDLLSILSTDGDSQSELEAAMTSTDSSSDAVMKQEDIESLVAQLSPPVGTNPGSGDIDTDLVKWFNGEDTLPSDKLNSYVSNTAVKLDYGMSRHAIANYTMMGDLGKFLRSSYDILFDPNSIMGLTPDEIESRVKLAFTMYKELGSLNQRTVENAREYRLKSNSEDEISKLSMLLASIPSEKLKMLLTEISSSK